MRSRFHGRGFLAGRMICEQVRFRLGLVLPSRMLTGMPTRDRCWSSNRLQGADGFYGLQECACSLWKDQWMAVAGGTPSLSICISMGG